MSSLPQIGMRLHGGLAPQLCVELAQHAEHSGFASIWIAENPFERGVLPAATACALATERVRIGIGVWNPFIRHPVLIAMEIGALDALAGGRAALGIGSGRADNNQQMKVASKTPLGGLRDTIHIVRGLLAGDTVTHSGKVFSVDKVKLGYTPPRPDMPLLLAARGDNALQLCGELADGIVISNMCPPGYSEYAVDQIRMAERKAGRPKPGSIVQYVSCLCRRDSGAARREIRAAIAANLVNYWTVPTARQAMFRHRTISEAEYGKAVERLAAGESAHDVIDDRFVDAFSVAGDADECIDLISSYGRAGVNEVVLTFLGNQPREDIAYFGGALKGA